MSFFKKIELYWNTLFCGGFRLSFAQIVDRHTIICLNNRRNQTVTAVMVFLVMLLMLSLRRYNDTGSVIIIALIGAGFVLLAVPMMVVFLTSLLRPIRKRAGMILEVRFIVHQDMSEICRLLLQDTKGKQWYLYQNYYGWENQRWMYRLFQVGDRVVEVNAGAFHVGHLVNLDLHHRDVRYRVHVRERSQQLKRN
jgi:hypothetical protein